METFFGALKTCAGPENFVRGGLTLTTFFYIFLVDEGWVDPNSTISRPPLARQRNAISMTFFMHSVDGHTLNAGLVAIFSGDLNQNY